MRDWFNASGHGLLSLSRPLTLAPGSYFCCPEERPEKERQLRWVVCTSNALGLGLHRIQHQEVLLKGFQRVWLKVYREVTSLSSTVPITLMKKEGLRDNKG